MRLALTVLAGAVFLNAGQRLTEGLATSPVRVVIYEDLQCSDCADFRRMLDQKLLPRYQARVAFEHRDFPLAKHPWARPAAIASRYLESIRPELVIPFRRRIMSEQPKITKDNFPAWLSTFAKTNGLDPAKFQAALQDPALASAVEADFQDGVARGIAKTPTVLVNGQPFIEQFPYEDIAKAIDSELAANQ